MFMVTPNNHYTKHSKGSAKKSKSKISLHWTMAILVPEVVYAQLHVLEDDHMTSWLGKISLLGSTSMALVVGNMG